jgi:hypothetical protein
MYENEPGKYVLKILSSISLLEQYSYNKQYEGNIPFVLWRFHKGSDELYLSVTECINSYLGITKWIMVNGKPFGPKKNSYICPEYYMYDNLKNKCCSIEYYTQNKVIIDSSFEDLLNLGKYLAYYFMLDYEKCISEDIKVILPEYHR